MTPAEHTRLERDRRLTLASQLACGQSIQPGDWYACGWHPATGGRMWHAASAEALAAAAALAETMHRAPDQPDTWPDCPDTLESWEPSAPLR